MVGGEGDEVREVIALEHVAQGGLKPFPSGSSDAVVGIGDVSVQGHGRVLAYLGCW